MIMSGKGDGRHRGVTVMEVTLACQRIVAAASFNEVGQCKTYIQNRPAFVMLYRDLVLFTTVGDTAMRVLGRGHDEESAAKSRIWELRGAAQLPSFRHIVSRLVRVPYGSPDCQLSICHVKTLPGPKKVKARTLDIALVSGLDVAVPTALRIPPNLAREISYMYSSFTGTARHMKCRFAQ